MNHQTQPPKLTDQPTHQYCSSLSAQVQTIWFFGPSITSQKQHKAEVCFWLRFWFHLKLCCWLQFPKLPLKLPQLVSFRSVFSIRAFNKSYTLEAFPQPFSPSEKDWITSKVWSLDERLFQQHIAARSVIRLIIRQTVKACPHPTSLAQVMMSGWESSFGVKPRKQARTHQAVSPENLNSTTCRRPARQTADTTLRSQHYRK